MRNVPVMELPAHTMRGDRVKALEAGCDDYDTKPVELDRLIETIERPRALKGLVPLLAPADARGAAAQQPTP